jgi:hypothetical protein
VVNGSFNKQYGRADYGKLRTPGVKNATRPLVYDRIILP